VTDRPIGQPVLGVPDRGTLAKQRNPVCVPSLELDRQQLAEQVVIAIPRSSSGEMNTFARSSSTSRWAEPASPVTASASGPQIVSTIEVASMNRSVSGSSAMRTCSVR
jgi:hypothetical protein